MKQTVTIYDLREAFRACDRYNSFTYEGYEVLLDVIEQMEADTGQETELDVIALCCEFNEETPEEIAAQYDIDLSDLEKDDDGEYDHDDLMEVVLDYLNDNTFVCGQTDNTIVYQAF